MRVLARTAPFFLALAAAGCEPPMPPSTERIIRIQIEGCEEGPAAATTPAIALAVTPPAAAGETPPSPNGKPVGLQTHAPRTPAPPQRTPEALAADYRLRREGFLATMAERRLGPADLADGWRAYRRADDFFRQRNFDEALRSIETAALDAQSLKIGESFLSKKFTRVDARIAAMKLPPAAQNRVSKRMAAANQAFLNNQFEKANRILYEVEQALDARQPR